MIESVCRVFLDRENNELRIDCVVVASLDDDQADLVQALLERGDDAMCVSVASEASYIPLSQWASLAAAVRARRIAEAEKAFPVGSRVRHRTASSLGVGIVTARECDDEDCAHEGATDQDPQGGCDIGNCIGYVLVSWLTGGGGFYWPSALERIP